MNLKLVLGIVAPLVIIIILVILGSSKVGFSISTENRESVQFSSMFTQLDGPQSEVVLQTITLTNDFFLPRRYELPRVAVCFYDKEGLKRNEYLEVHYTEGRYSAGSDVPVFDEFLVEPWRSASSSNLDIAGSVELPKHSKKQIKILLKPKEFYSYRDSPSLLQQILPYKSYEELLLIQPQGNNKYYYLCENLGSDEWESAIHIPIVEQDKIIKEDNETCYDTDKGINYYVRGTVSSSIPGDAPDTCAWQRKGSMVEDKTILEEWYCDNQTRAKIEYKCPNECLNGICI